MTYSFVSGTTLSSNSTVINFSAIPQTYKDLLFVVCLRTTNTGAGQWADTLRMEINGDTTNAYYRQSSFSNTAGTVDNTVRVSSSDPRQFPPYVPTQGWSNSYSATQIYFADYTFSTDRPPGGALWYGGFTTSISLGSYYAHSGGSVNFGGSAGTPVTSVRFALPANQFIAGSQVYLYGIF